MPVAQLPEGCTVWASTRLMPRTPQSSSAWRLTLNVSGLAVRPVGRAGELPVAGLTEVVGDDARREVERGRVVRVATRRLGEIGSSPGGGGEEQCEGGERDPQGPPG